MLLGTTQKAAAEFSFILSVPVMIAATGYDIYKSYDILTKDDFFLFLIGGGVAFIVAMGAIFTFLKLIKHLRLSYFAYYRFLLAAVFFYIIYL
jgi:undecaprenyl-diphosphatase